jgi:glycosyl transferase family 87
VPWPSAGSPGRSASAADVVTTPGVDAADAAGVANAGGAADAAGAAGAAGPAGAAGAAGAAAVATRATRAGRLALGLVGVSVGLVLAVGLLGPSVAQVPLGPRRPHPPYSLFLHGSPWLVTGLVGAALVAGVAALLLGLHALRRGWSPDPRRLLAGALVAVAVLMLAVPTGSADPLSYAAYGRIVVQGGDPYADPPDRWRGGTDPVAGAVEEPWRWATSVYGPVATAEQGLASLLGGSSLHTTVLMLMLMNAAAFLAAGLVLHRMLRGDRRAQARAALLWSLNPLLLYELVAGAHVDTLCVALGVAGIAAIRRSALLAGLLVGAAVAVKAPAALYGVALVWALRHDLRRIPALAAGALGVLVPSYLLAGPHVFDQIRRASHYVSIATPWRRLLEELTESAGNDAARRLIVRLAIVAAVLLVVVLVRAVPHRPDAAGRPDLDAAGRPDLDAARMAFVLTLAWVLTAPYSLPWYDAFAWAPLALLPASAFDAALVARTFLVALAYVPGRAPDFLPHDLARVTLDVRSIVVPSALTVLLTAVVVLGLVRTFRSRRAPAP